MLMIGKTLTEEQRLTKAMADIIGNTNYIAIAGILMMGDHKIVPTGEQGCRTAMTNGVNAWYARDFVAGLSDAELRFLILHESYHVLYKHLTTYRYLYDLNRYKANLACDYVINLKLIDFDKETGKGFIAMPKVGVIDEKYRGMDSAQVYALLPDDDGKGKGKGKGSGQGQGQGQPDGEGDPSDGEGDGETMDQHDWEGADELSPEEKKEIERAIDEAVRQGALIAGKMGSGGSRLLDDVMESKIDWREVLRDFVSTTCAGNDYSTWRRPNRRYISSGIYLPSGVSETVGELVIAIDTSGSIGGRELSQFLGEVAAIAKSVKPQAVRLLYWDTEVCADEYYLQDQLDDIVKSTKPAGGGGTMVECVPDYLREKQIKPQAAIILTDGYLGGSWGTWHVPVLWCVLDNKNAKPTNGKAVHIESSSM
jgi:predicted metal-dependent peptidase